MRKDFDKKILITGAPGFIGSHLCKLAMDLHYDVFGLGLTEEPPAALDSAHYFRCVGNPEELPSIVRQTKPAFCIHAAGRASVGASVSDPAPDFRAGPILTFSILDALRREAPSCRFLFLSSAAVYGNPRLLPISEDQELAPISPYGFHKLQSEIICREFAQVYGMSTAIVRIFSAYGEGLRRQVLWDACQQLMQNEILALRGTGSESRDFLHVTDIVTGVFKVLEYASTEVPVYNLASGRQTTIRELAMMVISALKAPIHPRFDGVVPSGDPLRWCADISEIKKIGFHPTIGIQAGVPAYATWCQQQLIGEAR